MKRVLLQLHLWLGLVLCIPFILLGLTGSVLVYDQEIIAGGVPLPQASETGTLQSASAIIGAAVAARPGSTPNLLTMPAEPGEPAIVRVPNGREPRGAGRISPQAFVDPVSLQILEVRESQNSGLVKFAHDMHGRLLIERTENGLNGRSIVGWLGVAMTIIGISGIVIWWPKKGQWRRSFGIRKGARGFLLQKQLHTTVGISTWVVFVVVSFTGVAICFPDTIAAMFGAKPSMSIPKVEAVAGTSRIGVDEAVSVALAAAPATRLASVSIPREVDDPYRINLTMLDAPAGGPLVSVAVDPYRARAVMVRDSRIGGPGQTLMAWQRPLHGGHPLGWVGRLLVFVSGLLPLLFSITGISMWLARRRIRSAVVNRGAVFEGAAAE